ncbi:hypothetical protein Nepgr_009811 [Nepenthes gracilis]|uniref:Uncharacterized protein n=1 Tax=Nepenthes gracilis TaxID=150966 RepID=A0AAD3SC29_NEPGR|nr:hypothetical protein Nepgr_009811 [Nepenthes gracilis]
MAGGQRPGGLKRSCVLLIVIAGMERFAFKGVASNLVTYLTDVVGMSNSWAAKAVNSWCGFTSIVPLLVAPLAESFLDHHSTILASSFFYVAGLVTLTSTAFDRTGKTTSFSFLFWCLCLISLGQGGYNPSLQALGADQLEEEQDLLPCAINNQTQNKRSSFFTWWYFGVCTGSLLGVSLMSYVQDSFGWGLGFAIPSVVMITSVLLFSWGSHFYEDIHAGHLVYKPFRTVLQALRAAASKAFNCKISVSDSDKPHAVELELQQKPLCNQNFVGVGELDKCSSCLVENGKAVIRLLPIWTMLLIFAVIFQQPATFFTKQGMTMQRSIGSNFKIPPATLQSAITVSIIVLMPLYDKLLVPLARAFTQNEKGVSVMQRMGIGMFLSTIAMMIAALVEEKRLQLSINMESETVGLSIFWLLPQYILLGISDIFTVVGMQEFFYGEVPVEMRTMGIALYTSVFGVGSFMSALLISLIELFTCHTYGAEKHCWFSDDMREARLDKYYWLLACLSSFSMLLYVILCKFHKSTNATSN